MTSDNIKRFEIHRFDSRSLPDIIGWLKSRLATGSLTINFCRGRISGMMEWKQDTYEHGNTPTDFASDARDAGRTA